MEARAGPALPGCSPQACRCRPAIFPVDLAPTLTANIAVNHFRRHRLRLRSSLLYTVHSSAARSSLSQYQAPHAHRGSSLGLAESCACVHESAVSDRHSFCPLERFLTSPHLVVGGRLDSTTARNQLIRETRPAVPRDGGHQRREYSAAHPDSSPRRRGAEGSDKAQEG